MPNIDKIQIKIVAYSVPEPKSEGGTEFWSWNQFLWKVSSGVWLLL